MNLQEIKNAVDSGVIVHHHHAGYRVIKGAAGYMISNVYNNNCIGLTWRNGVTMNGKEADFYIPETEDRETSA